MIVNSSGEPTPEQIAERARANAEREARAQIEAERRQAEAARVVAEAQIARRRQNAEDTARDQLRGLRDLYATRGDAAREIVDMVSRFWDAETAIRSRLDGIRQGLSASWSGIWPDEADRRWLELRREAGLPVLHNNTSVAPASDEADRVARAVICGMIDGYIGPDWIGVGVRGVTFG